MNSETSTVSIEVAWRARGEGWHRVTVKGQRGLDRLVRVLEERFGGESLEVRTAAGGAL